MERFRNITIILLLAVVLPASGAAVKSPSVLLQEGLYAEQIEGDLDAAIKIYRQVIAEAKETERAAAQATYRIGMCYLKKGRRAEAATEFRKLLSRFPEQESLAREAQKQLAKLEPPSALTDSIITQPNTRATLQELELYEPLIAALKQAIEKKNRTEISQILSRTISQWEEFLPLVEGVHHCDNPGSMCLRLFKQIDESLTQVKEHVPASVHDRLYEQMKTSLEHCQPRYRLMKNTLEEFSLLPMTHGYMPDIPKSLLMLSGFEETCGSIAKSVEENTYEKAIEQVESLLDQEEEFETAVKGSQAESLAKTLFKSLRLLRDALEKSDIQRVYAQFEVIGPLGPKIESVLMILRNQAKYGLTIDRQSSGSDTSEKRIYTLEIKEKEHNSKTISNKLENELPNPPPGIHVSRFRSSPGHMQIEFYADNIAAKDKYVNMIKNRDDLILLPISTPLFESPVTIALYNIIHPVSNYIGRALDLDEDIALSIPDDQQQEEAGDNVKWLVDRGADLVAGFQGNEAGLMGFNMFAETLPARAWDELSKDELLDKVSGKQIDPNEMQIMKWNDVGEQFVFAFATSDGAVGLLQILSADEKAQKLEVRYKKLQKESAGRTVFLPDADDVIQQGKVAVVLDLATGEMLPGSTDKQYFNKLNKGDVAYADDEGKDILACFRGAKITRKTANGKYYDTPDQSHTENTIHLYIIKKTPAEWTITTKEGDIYELIVLSLDLDSDKFCIRQPAC